MSPLNLPCSFLLYNILIQIVLQKFTCFGFSLQIYRYCRNSSFPKTFRNILWENYIIHSWTIQLCFFIVMFLFAFISLFCFYNAPSCAPETVCGAVLNSGWPYRRRLSYPLNCLGLSYIVFHVISFFIFSIFI